MATNKTADEVRAEQLAILGADLGTFYGALQYEVTWCHAKWQQYRILFAHTDQRVDLLNEAAGFFFKVVQDVMWEDVLLHVARLTDPPKSAGKANLTIHRLPDLVTDSVLASEVRALAESASLKCAFAREWRHRHLAHRDLDLALDRVHALPLPPVSRLAVTEALGSISSALNRVESHYFDSHVAFEHFVAHDDANALVYYLAKAVRSEERQRERFAKGQPSPEDLEPEPEV